MAPATAEHVKQLYMQKAPNQVVVSLSALVRLLQFKMSSSKQVATILPFQVESLTSMSLQEIIYTTLMRPAKEGIHATIFLTSKETLRERLEDWGVNSIIPDRAVATFRALANFSEWAMPDSFSGYMVDLGSARWTCAWVERGQVKKGFTMEEGIETLLSSLWEDVKKVLFQKEVEGVASQMDLLQLNTQLHPHLAGKLGQLKATLARILYSFSPEASEVPTIFTGRVDAFGHFREYLLEKSCGRLTELSMPLEEQKCAIAIGSALEEETQFLHSEFTPKKTWQKVGRWTVLLGSISLLATVGILLSGHAKFQSKKEDVGQAFHHILSKSDPKLANMLFLDDLERGIEEAALVIQKYNKETPYLLRAPNVTEALGWISSHPFIEALATTEDPLVIQTVKYQLVSFPHIDAMRDPYKAKLELEFMVKSPMNARKFHEALLQEDDFVDGENEFSWEASDDVYRTSFFLKNKALQ